jgi:hypothetical protein
LTCKGAFPLAYFKKENKMNTNKIQGLFITEDQAYDLACHNEFISATPYNLAIMQIRNHWSSIRQEELYTPVIEFKVRSSKTNRNKKFWTDNEIVWTKGIVGWCTVKSHINSQHNNAEYDVRSALIKLGLA